MKSILFGYRNTPFTQKLEDQDEYIKTYVGKVNQWDKKERKEKELSYRMRLKRKLRGL
jgi:hypothetical protein